MRDNKHDDDLPFDPFALWGSALTLLAYFFCFGAPRVVRDGVYLNLVAAVLVGALATVLSLWVFLRRARYHTSSRRLAAFNSCRFHAVLVLPDIPEVHHGRTVDAIRIPAEEAGAAPR